MYTFLQFFSQYKEKTNCQILFTKFLGVLVTFTFANRIDSPCTIFFGGSNLIFLPRVYAVSGGFSTTDGIVDLLDFFQN